MNESFNECLYVMYHLLVFVFMFYIALKAVPTDVQGSAFQVGKETVNLKCLQ